MFDITPMLNQPFSTFATAKNARTPITDKIKEIYDKQGKEAALEWIRKNPNKTIDSIKKQDESFVKARLESALEQY